jgi:hypothetical protein
MTDTNQSILTDLAGAGISYVACPYSHDSKAVMEHRSMAATRLATWLTRRQVTVFSPLTQSVEMERQANRDGESLPHEYAFWKKHDRTFVSMSSALVVLALEGWAESTGVSDEIHTALDFSLPVILAIPYPSQEGLKRYGLKRAPYKIDSKKNEVEAQGHLFEGTFEYRPEQVAEDSVTLGSLGFDDE